MSLNHGHLSVYGTRIEVFWVYEAERLSFSDLHGLVYALSSMAAHLPYLPGSPSSRMGPNFLRSACPSTGCQPSSFTGSMPSGDNYRRLLAHSLFQLFPTNRTHTSAPFGGRFLMHSHCCHSRLVTGTGSPFSQLPGSGREQC